MAVISAVSDGSPLAAPLMSNMEVVEGVLLASGTALWMLCYRCRKEVSLGRKYPQLRGTDLTGGHS